MQSTLFYFIYDGSEELKHMQSQDEKKITDYLHSIDVDEKTCFIKINRGEFKLDNIIFARRTIIWYNGHGKISSNDKDPFPCFTGPKFVRVHQTSLHEEILNKNIMGLELLITVFNCCNFSGLADEDVSKVKDPSPTIFDFTGSAKVCSSVRGSKAYYDSDGSYFTKAFFLKFDTNWKVTTDRVNHDLNQHQQAKYQGMLEYQEVIKESPKELNIKLKFDGAINDERMDEIRNDGLFKILTDPNLRAIKKRKMDDDDTK